METALIRHCLACAIPALGICRGIQLFNAALGGTLWQDLPSERPSATRHQMTPPYARAVHSVRIHPQTRLWRILSQALGKDELTALGVNSYHHQAVRELAPMLCPCATSEDGLIEGLEHPDMPFFLAVQWHPEFWPEHPASQAIFRAFVEAALSRKKARKSQA